MGRVRSWDLTHAAYALRRYWSWTGPPTGSPRWRASAHSSSWASMLSTERSSCAMAAARTPQDETSRRAAPVARDAPGNMRCILGLSAAIPSTVDAAASASTM